VLDKRGLVARIASAGIARAVDPAFTPLDGAAANVTAAAIRDAVRQSA
jgi:L-aminopeptidase/D-esterase-like protein